MVSAISTKALGRLSNVLGTVELAAGSLVNVAEDDLGCYVDFIL